MLKFIVTTVILLFTTLVFSQDETDIFQKLDQKGPNEGSVSIMQDPGIADLVKTHISQNKKITGIDGWRIQLYSGAGANAKKEASDIKSRAMKEYPDHKVYLIYNAPFWWVRIGDYRDKSESLVLYHKLKNSFIGSYPVKDDNVQLTGLPN